jgi:dephospho-CoA kinase
MTRCESFMKRIIVVTGLPGSGKSEVSREIKRRRIPTFFTGSIIKDEVVRLGLDLTVESSEYVARELRKQYGPDAPIRMIEHGIESIKAGLVCVDGPRNIKEIDLLRTHGEVFLVIVESAKKLRYNRLIKRASVRDPEKWERFLWRDRKELERGMHSLLRTRRYKRYVIKNTGTVTELRSKVMKVLKNIRDSR